MAWLGTGLHMRRSLIVSPGLSFTSPLLTALPQHSLTLEAGFHNLFSHPLVAFDVGRTTNPQ